jgi:hypothetical protein
MRDVGIPIDADGGDDADHGGHARGDAQGTLGERKRPRRVAPMGNDE